MPDIDRIGRLCRIFLLLTVIVLLPAASGGADPVGLTEFLPRHAATMFGADIAALCANEQSAVVFVPLKERFPILADGISHAVFACDAAGQKRNWLVSFKTDDMLDAIWDSVEKRFASSRHEFGGKNIFYLRGKPGERKAFRLIRINPQTAAVYTRYPYGDRSIPDSKGISAALSRYLPRRSGIFLWGYGTPRIPKPYLKDISKYSFVLEKGADGELYIHGEVAFNSAMGAVLANNFVFNVLPVVLEKKYLIPVNITNEAVRSLVFERKKNLLRFSGREMGPVLVLASKIIAAEAESWESLIK